MGPLELLHAALKIAAVAFAALAVALVLLESGVARSNSRSRRWLSRLWRDIGRTPWMSVPREVTAGFIGRAEDIVRRGFENADKTSVFNAVFLGLVFMLIPGAALINALTGGRPFLLVYCLSLVGAFAFLNFAGESARLRPLNAVAAFYLGVSVVFVIPFYVLYSFTEVTIHNTFSHAVMKSVLVAVFWYIAAYALMLAVDVWMRSRGRDPGASATALAVRIGLASIPVAYLLTFLALLVGHVPALDPPRRSWSLILASVISVSLAFPLEFAVLKGTARKRGSQWLLAGWLAAAAVATLAGCALLYFAYAFSIRPLPPADVLAVLVGMQSAGGRYVLGYDFWLMHLPFIPLVILMGEVGFAWLAKAASVVFIRFGSGTFAEEKPFLAGAALAASVAVLAWGATGAV
ncbi:MAG: hypothetical protein EXQ86_09380 [Rhodospirillales bacterium]|nr:hypothetical protein [Rhodospirillales bacterium]